MNEETIWQNTIERFPVNFRKVKLDFVEYFFLISKSGISLAFIAQTLNWHFQSFPIFSEADFLPALSPSWLCSPPGGIWVKSATSFYHSKESCTWIISRYKKHTKSDVWAHLLPNTGSSSANLLTGAWISCLESPGAGPPRPGLLQALTVTEHPWDHSEPNSPVVRMDTVNSGFHFHPKHSRKCLLSSPGIFQMCV